MSNLPWPDMQEEEVIGYGSYGTVYRVTYNRTTCALKRIHIPANSREFDSLLLRLGSREKVRSFCREAAEDLMGEIQILKRFQGHPNIVTILDSAIKDTENGSELFLLMEYLQPFSDYEITHVMEEPDVIKMGIDLCSALEAIEKEGILHRDLKPDNILVTPDGSFKICDFGVARNLERTVSDLSLKGTFSFMAPEVYHGKPYDKRADLYSLGLILYRAANHGRLPFMSQDLSMVSFKDKEESLNRRMNGEAFPLPENAGEAFSEVLLKACAYYPEKRFACAADMKQALSILQKGGNDSRGSQCSNDVKDNEDCKCSNDSRACEDNNGSKGCEDGKGSKSGEVSNGSKRGEVSNGSKRGDDGKDNRGRKPSDRKKHNIARIYAKRTKSDNIRIACIAVLLLILLAAAGKISLYLYREYCVNYCDTALQKRLEETYGVNLTARLNGNGVLYIGSNEDFLWELAEGSYPWMNEKNRIRKVVLGPEVTRIHVEGDESIRYDSRGDLVCFKEGLQFCPNLEELTIESSSLSLNGNDLFKGDTALRRIHCAPDTDVKLSKVVDNAWFADTPWVTEESFRMLGSTLIRYNGTDEDVDGFPIQTKRIAPDAFAYNSSVRNIILPEGVTDIGANAFEQCRNLETILLPEKLKEISEAAFTYCSALKQIRIPSGVSDIGLYTFKGCISLTDFQVDSGNSSYQIADGCLYDIDKRYLFWCSPAAAGEVILPESLEMIQAYAFADAPMLSGIVFPEKPLATQTNLFDKNPLITRIVVPDNQTAYFYEDGILYSPDKTQLMFCERDQKGSLKIKEGIVVIHDYAFACCHELTQIILPETLHHILTDAFRECTSLKSIYIPASVSFVANHLFEDCSALEEIRFGGTREAWEKMIARFDLGIDTEKTRISFMGKEYDQPYVNSLGG